MPLAREVISITYTGPILTYLLVGLLYKGVYWAGGKIAQQIIYNIPGTLLIKSSKSGSTLLSNVFVLCNAIM